MRPRGVIRICLTLGLIPFSQRAIGEEIRKIHGQLDGKVVRFAPYVQEPFFFVFQDHKQGDTESRKAG